MLVHRLDARESKVLRRHVELAALLLCCRGGADLPGLPRGVQRGLAGAAAGEDLPGPQEGSLSGD